MRFQDLDVWKRAVSLSSDIYLSSDRIKDFGYRHQLTGSGLSIPSNIAEGVVRDSTRECTRFLTYAKASGGELFAQIIIGKNVGFIDSKQAESWIKETKEITAILGSIIIKRRQFTR